MAKTVSAADARRPRRAVGRTAPAVRMALLPGGWKLGAGAGVLGAEGATCYLYPAAGVVLAVADVLIPTAVTLVLLAAILRGSTETCERVFRLLRWIAGRPEPPAPGGPRASGQAQGSGL